MEPKIDRHDDSELKALLREWQAPEIASSLEERILNSRRNWWSFLLKGSIPVPVPLACGLVMLLAFGGWRLLEKQAPNVPCVTQSECSKAASGSC